jgi:carbonic anhydrase
MSCINGTSPIDINISNVINNCDLKCSYNYDYSNANPVITNNGDYLSLSYENTNTDKVSYNADTLYVQEIRIYAPSLHSYNSQKTDAEMIIVHNSGIGLRELLVCIPIKNTNANTSSSTLLTTIISTASIATPSSGLSTTLNTTEFNLNTFILSNKPFYSYTGTLPYQPCNSNANFVVYSVANGNIDITTDTLSTLTSIITPNVYDVKTGGQLFYNPKGANTNSLSGGGVGNNEIYIDCQPTGVSDEQEEVVVQSYTTTPITFSSVVNNQYFQIFFFIFVILIIIFGFYFIIHKTVGDKIEMPKISKMSYKM